MWSELALLALKGILEVKVMAKIFERNPDNGEIRSRDVNHPTKAQQAISRSEILDEIWAADKHTHDGHWYVKLSDVCEILGEDYARQEK